MNTDIRMRCGWVNQDPLYIKYHDTEWGVPSYNDIHLFEMLCLEGAQAGLSWITILRKRENYRRAFDHFNPAQIVLFSEEKIQLLLQDQGIVRNKLKIRSVITNAQKYIDIVEKYGSFHTYIWKFVDGIPKKNQWRELQQVPPTSKESDCMSKELKQIGFRFVGSTICYSFMQATGMVNDHLVSCFRYNKKTYS